MSMRLSLVAILCILGALMLRADVAAQGSTATPQVQGSPDAFAHMAAATRDMAQTCQLMMQREMERGAALRRFTMPIGIFFASLLALALVLFVILEIQWIR